MTSSGSIGDISGELGFDVSQALTAFAELKAAATDTTTALSASTDTMTQKFLAAQAGAAVMAKGVEGARLELSLLSEAQAQATLAQSEAALSAKEASLAYAALTGDAKKLSQASFDMTVALTNLRNAQEALGTAIGEVAGAERAAVAATEQYADAIKLVNEATAREAAETAAFIPDLSAMGAALEAVNGPLVEEIADNSRLAEAMASVGDGLQFATAMQDEYAHAIALVNEATQGEIAADEELVASEDRVAASGRTISPVLIAIAAAMGVIKSIDIGVQFEEAMTKVETFAGASHADMGMLTQDVEQLAIQSGKGPKQLADALYYVYSAGFQGKAAMDVLTVATRTAVAAQTDATPVANALTSAIRAYGQSQKDATADANTLSAIVVGGKMTWDDLAGAIGKTLPLASAAGVSLQQIGANMDVMTQKGLTASDASSAFVFVLKSLEAPTKTAQAQLKEMGLSADDLRQAIRDRGLLSVLDELYQKTGGNIDQLSAIIPRVHGLTDVLATAGDTSGAYVTALDKINQTNDVVGKGFDTTEQTAGAALARLRTHLEVELIGGLKGVTSAIGPVVTDLTVLLDAFDQLPAPIKDIVVILPVAATGLILIGEAGKILGSAGTVLTGVLRSVYSALVVTTTAETAETAATEGAAAAATAAVGPFTMLGLAVPVVGVALVALTFAAQAFEQSQQGVIDKANAEKDALDKVTQAVGQQSDALRAAGQSDQEILDLDRAKFGALTLAMDDNRARLTALQQAHTIFAAQLGNSATANLNLGAALIQQGMTAKQVDTEIKTLTQTLKSQQAEADGLSTDIGKLTDAIKNQALAAAAAKQTQDQLAANLGITGTAAIAAAQAHEALDSAVKKSLTSTSDAIALQGAYKLALDDANLSQKDWATRQTALQELEKNGGPAAKAAAEAEITLANAMRTMGVDATNAAIALDKQTDSAGKLAQALAQLSTEEDRASKQTDTFNTQLAVGGATASAAFAGAYGQAAQQAAASMQAASQSAVQAWKAADAVLLQDEQNLAAATEPAEQTRLAAIVKTDQAAEKSALDAANARIKDENDYISAVEKASSDITSLNHTLHDDEMHLSHLTTAEKATDLDKWLQAEIVTANAIKHVEEELMTATSGIARALLDVEITALKAQLDQIKGSIQDAETDAGYIQKEIKADAGAATSALNGETQAQRDLNTVLKDGNQIAKDLHDLQTQAKADSEVVTQAQVDSARATTEADRQRAVAALADTQAANDYVAAVLGGYDQATKASRAYSQAEVANAEAIYQTKKANSDALRAIFDEDMKTQNTLQSEFDTQQKQAADAQKQYAADARTDMDNETKAHAAMVTAFIVGGAQLSASEKSAATSAFNAWHEADQKVLADLKAMEQPMSAAAYKIASDQLAIDTATATQRRQILDDTLKEVQAEANAEVTAARDAQDARKAILDLQVADVHGVATQEIAEYQSLEAQIADIDTQLKGVLTDDQRQTLEATRTGLDDRAKAVQAEAQFEMDQQNKIVDANRQAVSAIITDQTSLFDIEHKIATLSADERTAGVGTWLAAEASVISKIITLENAEAQAAIAGDLAKVASIKNVIANLEIEKAQYAAMASEAETNAQQLATNAQDAAQRMSDAAKAGANGTVEAVGIAANALKSSAADATKATDAIKAGLQSIVDSANAAKDALTGMTDVFNAPTAQEAAVQKQVAQLDIQIAQKEEGGTAATDPVVAELIKQRDALKAQADAYAAERKAMEELSAADGALNSTNTKTLDGLRGLQGSLTQLETANDNINQQHVKDVQSQIQALDAQLAAQQSSTSATQQNTQAIGGATAASGSATAAADAAMKAAQDNAKAANANTQAVNISTPPLIDNTTTTATNTAATQANASATTTNTASALTQAMANEQATIAAKEQAASTDKNTAAMAQLTAALATVSSALSSYTSSIGQNSGQNYGGEQFANLPHYQQGTNYVPSDGLAYLHKGEIVVPPGMPVGQIGQPYRAGTGGAVNLNLNLTVNGANLTPKQVEDIAVGAGQRILQQAFGRDFTLAGQQVG